MTLPDALLGWIASGLGGYVWDGSSPIGVDDLAVFDGIVPPKPPKRYAVVYMGDGTLRALAVCGQSDAASVRYQVTSVGQDRQMASWVATKIRDFTVDTKPTVAGWACGPICHSFGDPPSRDETVAELPVVFKIDLYDLLATRV